MQGIRSVGPPTLHALPLLFTRRTSPQTIVSFVLSNLSLNKQAFTFFATFFTARELDTFKTKSDRASARVLMIMIDLGDAAAIHMHMGSERVRAGAAVVLRLATAHSSPVHVGVWLKASPSRRRARRGAALAACAAGTAVRAARARSWSATARCRIRCRRCSGQLVWRQRRNTAVSCTRAAGTEIEVAAGRCSSCKYIFSFALH